MVVGRFSGQRARSFVVVALVVMSAARMFAQAPSAADELRAGIEEVKAGKLNDALTTLNKVILQASLSESDLVARAHLFRADAYLQMNLPENARTSAVLALDAEPAINIDGLGLSGSMLALIGELRGASPLGVESAAQSAEAAGKYQEAFDGYLQAYRRLPEPPPAADEQRLRQRIIETVRRLDRKPDIPAQATEHFAKALQLLDAGRTSGTTGTAASEAIATELQRAIRVAPWWSTPAFRLAVVLQELQRIDEAMANLDLYRLADPAGYAAAITAKPARPAIAAVAPAPPVSAAPPMVVAPPAVAPSAASVFIYWPPQQRGSGRPKVYCDGFHVADLQNRHFIVLEVTPGTHDIRFHNKTETFSFDAGRKHYVRASAEGFPVHAVLRQVTPEEGAAEIRNENVTSNDPRRTYSIDCSVQALKRKR